MTVSLAAGVMTKVARKPSFVDGIGSSQLLPKLWPFARNLLSGAFTSSTAEIAKSIRLLVERNRVVADGAGACPVAVALSDHFDQETMVCVVSGGNIDTDTLVKILEGALD